MRLLLLILLYSPQLPRPENRVQGLSQYMNMAVSIQFSICRLEKLYNNNNKNIVKIYIVDASRIQISKRKC